MYNLPTQKCNNTDSSTTSDFQLFFFFFFYSKDPQNMITNANVSLAIDIYLSYAKQSWYCPSTKQEEQSRYCLRAKLFS